MSVNGSFRQLDAAGFSDAAKLALAAHLESRAIWEPNSGCLIWLGAVNHAGYGQFGVKLASKQWKIMQAHRLAYWLHLGTLPDGQIVMHRCDIPCCVNPAHLLGGTQTANIADMNAKGRHENTRGVQRHNAKLDDEAVRLIRRSARSQADLARDYGVTPEAIWLVRHNKNWRHVI